MYGRSSEEVVPRNGHTLGVDIVARISGCANQKEVSLEDQEDHGKEVVTDLYSGPVDYHVIATKAKGERLDRPELGQIEARLRSCQRDILVVEDMGRLVRGAEAVRLCGVAVDHGVRVLSPNDCIDTAEDTWEEDVLDACKEHVGHNAHTSRRLKHKLMNRFKKYGGAVALEPAGYVKAPGAKTYHDWIRNENATPTIREGAQILRETLNCAAVADWFNQRGFPTGKHCRRKTWNGPMVRRYYANPILKGFPSRGKRHTVKHHESGRRISVPNPNGPNFHPCPHLAHLDEASFDDLNARLTAANGSRRRKKVDGQDPLLRRPRKRTRFPGQMMYCGICGHLLVYGGHGQNDHLMCRGAHDYRCWNAVTADGPLSARKIAAAVQAEIESLPDFDEAFLTMVNQEALRADGAREGRCAKLANQVSHLERQIQHLVAFIREGDTSARIREELRTAERELASVQMDRKQFEDAPVEAVTIPAIDEVKRIASESLGSLAAESDEFSRLMRSMIPRIVVYPHRLCDGGKIVLRARFRLQLSQLLPGDRTRELLRQPLERVLTVDLFDPPQRELHRRRILELRASGMTEKEAAKARSITTTAAQRAAALQRRMDGLGLTYPYLAVNKPPDDYGMLRRHKHRRYRFEPLDGAGEL